MGKKDLVATETTTPKLEEAPVEAPAPAPVAPVVAKPRMSFDVWFKCADRSAKSMNQPHHKAGMAAFANIAGKRTKEEWDRIFAAY